MIGGVFKRLSKQESVWFFIDVLLLSATIALSAILLLFAIHNMKRQHTRLVAHRVPPTMKTLYSGSSYTIQLPSQKHSGVKIACTGSLISKNTILTSSPCVKNIKYVKYKDTKYKVDKMYQTRMNSSQFLNYTLIEKEDLQLSILKILGNLQAAGLSVCKLPSLNYSVIYRGFGNMLYEKNEQTLLHIIDFVHPFYCHLVYEKYLHVIDFNLMICAITEHMARSGKSVCLRDAIGGPIMQNGFIIGVLSVSLIDTCGDPKKPFVFVNVIPFLQWLETEKIQYM